MLDRGAVFAGYRIETTLGRGGTGAVYLARHPAMPGPVALKLLDPAVSADPEIRARFREETEIVARLHHPGIVEVYDSGVDDGCLWLAMQYVDGRDATVISPRSLPANRVIALIDATAAALDYAHRAGVLHRDVKPANILLARPTRSRRETALLTDFGVGRLPQDADGPGTILATLAYAAPEQLRGQPLDPRADQYSLACTLFRMLTGVLPHAATNPSAMIKGHLRDLPLPITGLRPDLPAALDTVLARALAKHPAHRYPSCSDFLLAIHETFTTAARPEPRAAPCPPPPPSACADPPGTGCSETLSAYEPPGSGRFVAEAPSVVQAVEVSQPGHRRSMVPDRARLGYLAIATAAVLIVVIGLLN
ncbi:serine/threonine-protein kinase [Nocardia sp. NPDC127579]|uniref:serine/threonine-protein kinase n=1 Tax=Nocardia sp. NPDC127579 TaxID=3345402 RepID=UPI00363F6F2C